MSQALVISNSDYWWTMVINATQIQQRISGFILLVCAGFLMSGSAFGQSLYELKEGDQISISVWGEDELSLETLVLPDGSISFPLVGTLDVKGKTSLEVSSEIAVILDKYIPSPEVSVVVLSTDGNRIYVLGKVKTPGSIVMQGPMTVTQALSLSGGLDTFADNKQIRILRRNGQSQQQLAVNYDDILSGRDLDTNHVLQAGDTILVP